MKIFYGVSFTHGFCILVVPMKGKKKTENERIKVGEDSKVFTQTPK